MTGPRHRNATRQAPPPVAPILSPKDHAALAQAIAQHQAGHIDVAERAYKEILRRYPKTPDALHLLGVIGIQAGKPEQALRLIGQALRIVPNWPQARFNLGTAYQALGRLEESADSYLAALALMPEYPKAHYNLGGALYALLAAGKTERAQEGARAWLRDHPDNPMARHIGAAILANEAPPRASDAYVQLTFDEFSQDFETKLAALGYQAPQALATVLTPHLEAPNGELDIADIGCGTGLFGPHLRPYARHVVGVDLSTGMLGKAAARRLYDDLVQAEATSWLAGHAEAFDLITATDVLNYIGELAPLLKAAAAALRPNGVLAVTVEREAEGESFRFNPHGRYSHSEAYLRRVLAEAGFTLLQIGPFPLRKEGDVLVEGLTAVARLTSSA